MRKGFNIIQINGYKGMIAVAGIVVCLIAGFVVFPGIVLKSAWNFISFNFGLFPQIATLQGVLLWGIIVVSYFTFKKRGFMVEFKSSNDLTNAEMDEVMQRIRMEHQKDILTKAMMNAKEMEAKISESLKKEDNEINK